MTCARVGNLVIMEFVEKIKNATAPCIQKMKRGLAPVENFVRKFIYTDYYMWLILAIVFIGWVTRCAPFGFVALILVSSFVLLFADDLLPLLTNIFGAVLMIYKDTIEEFLYLWPVFIPLGIAIAVFVVRNVKLKKEIPDNKFRLGKMFFPQLAASIALLIGGADVVSTEGYLVALPNTLFLGVGVLAVYVLARNFIRHDTQIDHTTYVAKIMAYIGMVVALQLVIAIGRAGAAPAQWSSAYWDIGWGNRNNVATYFLFTAPMCLHLFTKHRYGVVYLLMGIVQYCCLILTFSRGGILFGMIAAVVGIMLTVYKARDRKRQIGYIAVAVGLMVLFYLIFMDEVNDVIRGLLGRGTGLSGRDLLYAEAWELFKAKPFLGHGLGYMGNGPGGVHEAIKIYWFHSTLFQVIACMGIVGILAYGYNYVVKGILIFKNWRNGFNLFVAVAFLGFEGYSMMDTGTMVPFPNMMIVILLMCVIEMFTSNTDSVTFDRLASKEIYVRETRPLEAKDAEVAE